MRTVALILIVLSFPMLVSAQPANDECSGAIVATIGTNAIDTLEATNSPEANPEPTCPGTFIGGFYSDVWFEFTAPQDGLMTITTCDTIDFDTDVAVYDGVCGALIPVACHGDTRGCLVQGTTNPWNTILENVTILEGGTYLIRIGGWDDFDIGGGTFEISVTSAPPTPPGAPENDECSGAIEAVLGDNPIDTANASDSVDPYSSSTGCTALGVMNQDVWYSWTAPAGGALTVSLCNNVDFDTDLVIYRGNCQSKIEVACSGDEPGCLMLGSNSAYASVVAGLQVSPGEEYLFRIGGWGDGQTGSGNVYVQFVPAIIDALNLSSVPGSAEIDCEALISDDCDAVVFSAGLTNSSQVTVNGPFTGGDLVTATLPVATIQTLVEVCASAMIGTASGAQFCNQIAVTGPVTLEGCSAPLLAIPDAGEPVEDFIDITGDPSSILWDLEIEAHVNHSDASQLRIDVFSTDGTSLTLHNQPVGADGGIDLTWWQSGNPNAAPYDQGGWMQPIGDLSIFVGSNPIGRWTLSISDEISGETGTLEEWCIRMYDTAPVINTGQDVIMGDPGSMVMVGREGSKASFGCESVICNGGTEPLDWYANPDPRHPMMAFNMYRLDSDRLIQIAGSWAKHGWSSAQANSCGFGCDPSPTNTQTGVGCSDTYGAAGNAAQINMGPRSEINPWTGAFIWDGSFMQIDNGPWDQVEERLSIEDDDLDPSLHPNSTWFSETYVVHPGDLDHTTNQAWEPVTVSGTPGGSWSIGMSAASQLGTVQAAWPGASIETLQPFPPIDGRCYLAHKATDNGDGTWHYEYSVFNLDLSRRAGSLTIPVSSDVEVTNISFYAPYVESIVYSNEPWTAERNATGVTWSTLPDSAGAAANPLRWGWLYNFGFDANAAPETGTASLGVHETSSIDSLEADVITPPTAPPDPLLRRGLCNPDGVFDIADVIFLLGYLFSGGEAPLCADACDTNDDGGLDIGDGISMLGSLFNGEAPPATPGPSDCGVDPTVDSLDCGENSEGCL